MKPSTELFDLIKSLTKSEKRFFKLSSSLQSGEKNYLKIFDTIEKQELYDEEAIKDAYKDETFIRHFPSEKNHLYKLILKSLRSYHADNSASSQLKQEIKNIELLFRKALFKECGKFLKRAKKIAYKNEKFYYLIDLIAWEKMLLDEAFEAGEFDNDLNEILDEERKVIEQLKNLVEYQVLYSKINYLFRLGGVVKSEKERQMVDEISHHPLIKDSSLALSTRAQSICYYVRGFCCQAYRDTLGSIENFEKAIEVMDNNPLIKADLPKRYIRSVTNVIYGYIRNKDYDKANHQIDVLNGLGKIKGFDTIDVSILIFFSHSMTELLFLNRQGRYEEAVEKAEEVAERMERLGDKLNKEKQLLLSYLISYVYFGNGKYKQSLFWINRVLNDNENVLRQDIFSYARIFNLVIHFELKNFDLLEYIIKSTNRYLNKKPQNFEVESLLVDYIKRLSKIQNPDDKVELFKELKDELETLFENPSDRVILEYVDFRSWINSKIQDVPFAKLVQERGKP
ncbi:hypothetical protein [Luteibaculum oceani]|uniref:Tetratricopeptide repeat protein n=1 Tax=Luteibaculum oceani TaxID=1294296 RepID=A0A5C6V1B3_9FLAO|nr:hypothetical protein [Luteibaculum oceani]TXC78441.1 hypothetical protein FRX97_08910 [Luteibaculum oceani]